MIKIQSPKFTCQTCGSPQLKVVSFSLGGDGRRIFFSRVNFVCWLSFSACSILHYLSSKEKTPVILPKVLVADYIAWPNKVGVGWLCCPGTVWEPIMEVSLHTTCQGILHHSCLSSLSHCGLILPGKRWNYKCVGWSPLQKCLKCRWTMNRPTFSQNSHNARKRPPSIPMFSVWPWQDQNTIPWVISLWFSSNVKPNVLCMTVTRSKNQPLNYLIKLVVLLKC